MSLPPALPACCTHVLKYLLLLVFCCFMWMERAFFNSVELTFKTKKQMMLDVANGMQYLHGQNPVIIHRDLKSLNVLIDENWVTKVRCGERRAQVE